MRPKKRFVFASKRASRHERSFERSFILDFRATRCLFSRMEPSVGFSRGRNVPKFFVFRLFACSTFERSCRAVCVGTVARARVFLPCLPHAPPRVVASVVGHEPSHGHVVATPIVANFFPLFPQSTDAQPFQYPSIPRMEPPCGPDPSAVSTKPGGSSDVDETTLYEDVARLESVQHAVVEVRSVRRNRGGPRLDSGPTRSAHRAVFSFSLAFAALRRRVAGRPFLFATISYKALTTRFFTLPCVSVSSQPPLPKHCREISRPKRSV